MTAQFKMEGLTPRSTYAHRKQGSYKITVTATNLANQTGSAGESKSDIHETAAEPRNDDIDALTWSSSTANSASTVPCGVNLLEHLPEELKLAVQKRHAYAMSEYAEAKCA